MKRASLNIMIKNTKRTKRIKIFKKNKNIIIIGNILKFKKNKRQREKRRDRRRVTMSKRVKKIEVTSKQVEQNIGNKQTGVTKVR